MSDLPVKTAQVLTKCFYWKKKLGSSKLSKEAGESGMQGTRPLPQEHLAGTVRSTGKTRFGCGAEPQEPTVREAELLLPGGCQRRLSLTPMSSVTHGLLSPTFVFPDSFFFFFKLRTLSVHAEKAVPPLKSDGECETRSCGRQNSGAARLPSLGVRTRHRPLPLNARL